MIEAIHHVHLAMPAGRETDAVDFYHGVLGLDQVEKPANLASRGGAWFELGSVKVHLGVDDNFRPGRKAHTAFLVSDLAGLRSRIETSGRKTYTDEPLPGFDRFYAEDPFGNRLEFLRPDR